MWGYDDDQGGYHSVKGGVHTATRRGARPSVPQHQVSRLQQCGKIAATAKSVDRRDRHAGGLPGGRVQKLAEARKKSLETRRKNAAKKKAALKEKEDKAAKYDEMVTKKKGKPKKEIEETQINLDDPIVARVANTARKNPKHDENVIRVVKIFHFLLQQMWCQI